MRGDENEHVYQLFIFFADRNPLLEIPSSVHPESEYWESYYSDIKNLPQAVKSDIRFAFVEGCEYRMPTNVGKNEYRFSFVSYGAAHTGRLETTLDLPPNHSIRLKIIEKGAPYPNPQTAEERYANQRSKFDWYEIIPTIEANPSEDLKKPCIVK
ncbi:hypothetical protein EHO59_05255 [Leptospira semungkisensis]|uniref:Uncharacterized protein n=1 Tax=Leptospira semungkisensis TaxID=2484985 RepID=A0A4R9G7R3_9LEPT|nr:hypothetical protein [Leptospira semungkisensis]TGK07511.1 hypothetical protein EHO59_05255 [Leptospira semungkisensis]